MRKFTAGALVALFLSMSFVLAGCSSRYDSRLLGRWIGTIQDKSMQIWNYEFRSDGTGRWHDGRDAPATFGETDWFIERETRFFEHRFTWSAQGDNRLEVLFEGNEEAFIYYYELIDDDKLLLRRETWLAGVYLERVE